jgi:hypothetical protein
MHRLYIFLTMTAVACATAASAAAAYTWSPPEITARLRGIVTFHPSGGTPFNCKIEMIMKTKGYGAITSVEGRPEGPQCPGISYQGLTWRMGIESPSTGQFGPFRFSRPANGSCSQTTIQFQDNSSGLFIFPAGQCMTGSLQSYPAVTIAP